MGFWGQKRQSLTLRWKHYQYGIVYLKATGFRIPSQLRINGSTKELKFVQKENAAFIYEFGEICVNDCYRLADLKKQLGQVKTIVDIGANQGLFAIAARQQFAHAAITCYEPNRQLQEQLGNNAVALNAGVFYEAVTRDNCRVNLHMGESDLHTTAAASASGTVPGTAFSTVIERAGGVIDILKMDCEGGEWAILEDRASWSGVRAVTMEYHLWARQGSSYEDISSNLQSLGFRITAVNKLTAQFGLVAAVKH